ncbi:hypothetical protein COA16_32515, partial [Bacillus thuringiensis]
MRRTASLFFLGVGNMKKIFAKLRFLLAFVV